MLKTEQLKHLQRPIRSPIKTANFTSPKPIALPLEIKNIIRKNPEATKAAKK